MTTSSLMIICMGMSLQARVALLPEDERRAWISRLHPSVLEEILRGEWWWTARPEQVPPPGAWFICLALAGRGFGKSRAGSEWIVEQTQKHPLDARNIPTEWLVIAETLSDARTICMEGPAGILRVLERRRIEHKYKMSPRPMVLFPNGSKIYTEGADNPDVGRGYNLSGAWLDEICVAKDEPVVTARGEVPVQDVRAGDQVWTRGGWRPVVHAGLTRQDTEVLEIRTTAGSVRVTPEHRVWANGRWVEARHVVPYDIMETCQPKATTFVLGVAKVSTPTDAYDITVEGDAPEFFAGIGQILVHNCKWKYPRSSWYEGILPSLRVDLINDHPRTFVTTTPKPVDLIQEWLRREDGTIHVIRGSTFDNKANLSSLVIKELEKRYSGTIIGRQELYGEMIEAFDGALFSRLDIENNRIDETPDDLVAIVVGVDPSLTGEDDEMGIVVCARGAKNHLYVLADRSIMSVGRAAAMAAWRVVAEFGADKLVCETNLGKRWMQQVFQDAYQESVELGLFERGTRPPLEGIDTKIGKRTRGEPVAMRCEQGRLHMVGKWPSLEDQMSQFTAWGKTESPDRLDAMVHACRYLMSGEKKQAKITSPADALSSTLQSLWREVEYRW